jgi:hypothetical protein
VGLVAQISQPLGIACCRNKNRPVRDMAPGDSFWRERTCDYCNASIKRVMVRFKSLSERRSSSILLMLCSTVV